MAITEQSPEKTREQLLEEIQRFHHPRTFQEMLGPEPQPGDQEDLEEFLSYLHSHREVVRTPDAGEHS